MAMINEMTPAEVADLLEAKARKLRETNDLISVIGSDDDDPDGDVFGFMHMSRSDRCGAKADDRSKRCEPSQWVL